MAEKKKYSLIVDNLSYDEITALLGPLQEVLDETAFWSVAYATLGNNTQYYIKKITQEAIDAAREEGTLEEEAGIEVDPTTLN